MYACRRHSDACSDCFSPALTRTHGRLWQGEARRLVEQQQKLAAWKQVLETVEQDDGRAVCLCIYESKYMLRVFASPVKSTTGRSTDGRTPPPHFLFADIKTAMANALGRPPAQDGEDEEQEGSVKVETPVGEVKLPDMKGILGAKVGVVLVTISLDV